MCWFTQRPVRLCVEPWPRQHRDLPRQPDDRETDQRGLGDRRWRDRHARDFTIDPAGKFLLVANQGADTVLVFTIDPGTGKLTKTAGPYDAPNPSFVGVLTLP